MGKMIISGDDVYYRQDSGEITARFTDFTEKMELSHQGSERYKKIFYVLLAGGGSYLGLLFFYL